ncbi:PilW family protein [uncultured Hydrogenophaga sp.]|uniref:PilW family protein n=1 Tax=uncultured Hydrogenophaga sp. TaxID=199683 RepID=UPI00258AF865|nr:PilW family protein [uncultured Hydrogenophaga sp.]
MKGPASLRRRATGFSLVELMVALALGLFLIGGILNIFLTNQQAFRTNDNLARLQENARLAFELTAREIRLAGGNVCGAAPIGNVLNNRTTQWSSNWDAGPIRGFDGNQVATDIVATGNSATQRVDGTDAIVVLTGAMDTGVLLANHDAATAVVQAGTVDHGLQTGEIVMVCDPQTAVIAQITAANSGTNANLTFAAGASPPSPGNCTIGLGFPTVCGGTGTTKTFSPGGFVNRLTASFWYVGNRADGRRSLYRMNAAGTSEEVAEGVTDMQISYLLRNTTSGALGTEWVDASAITDWTVSAPQQVVAVRARLLFQTAQSVGTDQQPLQRELLQVISVRNRSL